VYGAMTVGAIAVPISDDVAISTVEDVAKDCVPRLLVTSSEDLTHFAPLRDRLHCDFLLIHNTSSDSYFHHIREVISFSKHKDSQPFSNVNPLICKKQTGQ